MFKLSSSESYIDLELSENVKTIYVVLMFTEPKYFMREVRCIAFINEVWILTEEKF